MKRFLGRVNTMHGGQVGERNNLRKTKNAWEIGINLDINEELCCKEGNKN